MMPLTKVDYDATRKEQAKAIAAAREKLLPELAKAETIIFCARSAYLAATGEEPIGCAQIIRAIHHAEFSTPISPVSAQPDNREATTR